MVYTDETPLFRTLVTERLASSPPSARSKSPLGNGRSSSRHRDRKGKGKDEGDHDEFLREAYRIVCPHRGPSHLLTASFDQHNHLSALTTHLSQIRKPYLSLSNPPPSSRRYPKSTSSLRNGDDGDESMARWEGSKYLTDRERDEIDLRARIILRRCRERVSTLEDGEKTRQKIAHPPATSALFTLLPSLAPPSSSSNTLESTLILAHRSSIIWTLNNLLARNSALMSGLQEERAKRREERSRTLGGGAAREAAQLGTTINTTNGIGLDGVMKPETDIESQLSAEEIQRFESENNALLEHMQSQLSSVLSAEKSLLEISTLQTELVRHLVQQTEMTDRLYDEAVGSVGDVGKANEQLRKARRRGEEGRLFLLVFLVGASLALLFLDWYA